MEPDIQMQFEANHEAPRFKKTQLNVV